MPGRHYSEESRVTGDVGTAVFNKTTLNNNDNTSAILRAPHSDVRLQSEPVHPQGHQPLQRQQQQTQQQAACTRTVADVSPDQQQQHHEETEHHQQQKRIQRKASDAIRNSINSSSSRTTLRTLFSSKTLDNSASKTVEVLPSSRSVSSASAPFAKLLSRGSQVSIPAVGSGCDNPLSSRSQRETSEPESANSGPRVQRALLRSETHSTPSVHPTSTSSSAAVKLPTSSSLTKIGAASTAISTATSIAPTINNKRGGIDATAKQPHPRSAREIVAVADTSIANAVAPPPPRKGISAVVPTTQPSIAAVHHNTALSSNRNIIGSSSVVAVAESDRSSDKHKERGGGGTDTFGNTGSSSSKQPGSAASSGSGSAPPRALRVDADSTTVCRQNPSEAQYKRAAEVGVDSYLVEGPAPAAVTAHKSHRNLFNRKDIVGGGKVVQATTSVDQPSAPVLGRGSSRELNRQSSSGGSNKRSGAASSILNFPKNIVTKISRSAPKDQPSALVDNNINYNNDPRPEGSSCTDNVNHNAYRSTSGKGSPTKASSTTASYRVSPRSSTAATASSVVAPSPGAAVSASVAILDSKRISATSSTDISAAASKLNAVGSTSVADPTTATCAAPSSSGSVTGSTATSVTSESVSGKESRFYLGSGGNILRKAKQRRVKGDEVAIAATRQEHHQPVADTYSTAYTTAVADRTFTAESGRAATSTILNREAHLAQSPNKRSGVEMGYTCTKDAAVIDGDDKTRTVLTRRGDRRSSTTSNASGSVGALLANYRVMLTIGQHSQAKVEEVGAATWCSLLSTATSPASASGFAILDCRPLADYQKQRVVLARCPWEHAPFIKTPLVSGKPNPQTPEDVIEKHIHWLQATCTLRTVLMYDWYQGRNAGVVLSLLERSKCSFREIVFLKGGMESLCAKEANCFSNFFRRFVVGSADGDGPPNRPASGDASPNSEPRLAPALFINAPLVTVEDPTTHKRPASRSESNSQKRREISALSILAGPRSWLFGQKGGLLDSKGPTISKRKVHVLNLSSAPVLPVTNCRIHQPAVNLGSQPTGELLKFPTLAAIYNIASSGVDFLHKTCGPDSIVFICDDSLSSIVLFVLSWFLIETGCTASVVAQYLRRRHPILESTSAQKFFLSTLTTNLSTNQCRSDSRRAAAHALEAIHEETNNTSAGPGDTTPTRGMQSLGGGSGSTALSSNYYEEIDKLLTNLRSSAHRRRDFDDTISVLKKLLDNALREPDNPKFRTIRFDNPKIRETILRHPQATQLLLIAGWIYDQNPEGEVCRMMLPEGIIMQKLRDVRSRLP